MGKEKPERKREGRINEPGTMLDLPSGSQIRLVQVATV